MCFNYSIFKTLHQIREQNSINAREINKIRSDIGGLRHGVLTISAFFGRHYYFHHHHHHHHHHRRRRRTLPRTEA
jgi:hypothetical protein